MTQRHGMLTNVVLTAVAVLICITLTTPSFAAPIPGAQTTQGPESAEASACILTITCPPDRTIECHQSSAPSNTGTATFSANPDCGTVTVTFVDAVIPGTCPQERTIARTWTATAASGDVATCVQTIEVQDTRAPEFPSNCATSATFQCLAQVPPPGLGGVGPFDLCDPTITLTSVRTDNGGSGCPGDPLVITDTYTASDDCGNSSQCVRTYTVIDDTPPTITCPPDLTIVGAVPPCDPNDATASDNCGSVTITCSDGPLIGDPCNGTIHRTYVATDACGNTASCVQVLTVQDNTPPTITCPSDFAVECFEDIPACDPDDATVTDGCGPVTVTCTDGPLVGGPCGGTVTRTFVATDGAGNTATCDQIITVDDNTPPTITCPADFTIECLDDLVPCDPDDAVVDDNCAAPVTVTCSDGPLTGGECGGTIARTFVATDACGNTASCTQIITVDDNTPPTITCPAALTVECSSEIPSCNPADASASDNCDPQPTITCTDSPLAGDSCAGSIIRTYTATDACGNSASCDQIITVDDNTAPTITCPPSVTVECGTDLPPCGPDDVTVSDNCDAPVTVTCTESPLTGDPCTGSFVRTYVATDACGNTATCAQTVIIEDNEAPTITCPPDITVQRILDLPPCGTGDVIVDDNCSGEISITCSRRGLGGIGCTDLPIPVTYTFTATDGCGNQSQCTRIVTVLRPDCPFVVTAGNTGGAITAVAGQHLTLPLRVDTLGTEVAAFDLAIRFDQSIATILGVDRGAALNGWEHFTYRIESAGDGAGVLRLEGRADVNNGAAHPPYTAYTPLGDIALLRLSISPDAANAGQSLLFEPCLDGCTDNTVVSRDGEMTFVMAETDPEACGNSLAGSIVTGVRFGELRVDIAKPERTVGDINLNGIGYEVGDVVILANYLVNGASAFSAVPALSAQQTAASDVNNDGIVLTVADLRFLLRVISGSAAPMVGAKLAPSAIIGQTQYTVENGQLTVHTDATVDLGGAHFLFRCNGLSLGAPVLSNEASQMTVRANSVSGEYRVLVSTTAEQMASVSAGHRVLFTVPVTGNGTLDLVEAQMSDVDGGLLLSTVYKSVLPTDFALEQNYPNPFNAGSVIPFALKDASEWTLTIYNVMGQSIRSFSGRNDAGRVVVGWDGRDDQGGTVASGVYFYRLQTPTWNATKKMLLIK